MQILIIRHVKIIWRNRHYRRMINGMLGQIRDYERSLRNDPEPDDREFYEVEIRNLTEMLEGYGIAASFEGYKFLRWNG